MKGMIMAAGAGSRLMPLTSDLPKPMVPIANRPVMENVVSLIAAAGISQVVANLHYHADIIRNYFGNGDKWNIALAYSYEDILMGTAGGVKLCQNFLDDTFVVVSADVMTDTDLKELIYWHKKSGAMVSIGLTHIDKVDQFGVVVTNQDGLIQSFQEKPRLGTELSHMVNTGIYVMEPEVFNYIPEKTFYDFGKQVFPELLRQGVPFYGFNISGYWRDIGSFEAYIQANHAALKNECKYSLKGRWYNGSIDQNNRILVDDRVIISDSCQIKGLSVIGAKSVVRINSTIDSAILAQNVVVNKNCELNGCIIGSGCTIGQDTIIKPGAVIGPDCSIAPGSLIKAGTVITASDIAV